MNHCAQKSFSFFLVCLFHSVQVSICKVTKLQQRLRFIGVDIVELRSMADCELLFVSLLAATRVVQMVGNASGNDMNIERSLDVQWGQSNSMGLNQKNCSWIQCFMGRMGWYFPGFTIFLVFFDKWVLTLSWVILKFNDHLSIFMMIRCQRSS